MQIAPLFTGEQTKIIVGEKLKKFDRPIQKMFFDKVILSDKSKVLVEQVAARTGHEVAPFVTKNSNGVSIGVLGSKLHSLDPFHIHLDSPVSYESVAQKTTLEDLLADPLATQVEMNRAALMNDQANRASKSFEFLAAQALAFAKVDTSVLGGTQPAVDFGRDPSLTIPFSSSVDFETGDIIDIIQTIIDLVADAENGGNVEYMICGRDAARLIRRECKPGGKLYHLMDVNYGKDSEMKRGIIAGGEDMRYIGNLSGIVNVYEYRDYIEYNGQTIRPIPDKSVVFACKDIGGVLAFGALENAAAGYKAHAIFTHNYLTTGAKPQEFISTQSAPIAVVTLPNRTAIAQVLQ